LNDLNDEDVSYGVEIARVSMSSCNQIAEKETMHAGSAFCFQNVINTAIECSTSDVGYKNPFEEPPYSHMYLE
jgi:hypothetical protein